MIILIPMPLLFKVRLPAKNKAILGGVFCIGIFTVSNNYLRQKDLRISYHEL